MIKLALKEIKVLIYKIKQNLWKQRIEKTKSSFYVVGKIKKKSGKI